MSNFHSTFIDNIDVEKLSLSSFQKLFERKNENDDVAGSGGSLSGRGASASGDAGRSGRQTCIHGSGSVLLPGTIRPHPALMRRRGDA